MPDFAVRATMPEVMDDLHSSGADLQQALCELERINFLLGGNDVTLNGISWLLQKWPAAHNVHIADLGCGSGDMLRRIRRMAEKTGRSVTLTGIDANPNVVSFARMHTREHCEIQFEAVNIFSKEFHAMKFDVVTATLFFHHFTSEQLIDFFRRLKDQVSGGLVINDIHRHWFAYHAIKYLTGMFSKSPMVKNDAPLSVLRAFKKSELVEILQRAGLAHYRIRWCWAFRWQVVVSFKL